MCKLLRLLICPNLHHMTLVNQLESSFEIWYGTVAIGDHDK